MFKIALRNVMARKGRLLLSTPAAIAGCAFLAGVLVFSDTINDTIKRVFATAYDKTDAVVRSSSVIHRNFEGDLRGDIPDTAVAQVQKVPGVKSAVASVMGSAIVTD